MTENKIIDPIVEEQKPVKKKKATRTRRDINLVIVESPTKAKTIGKFLGKGYIVTSSFGHVRDLPKSRLAIDTEHNFEPSYTIPAKARPVVKELKELVKRAKIIYLATDADREGEAISWHLEEALKLDKERVKRIVFHEITKKAITEALEHPRDLNNNLINAQQARRVLDRLVGYGLSPILWHKIASGLSAGRVQSAALRLIVEREREIKAFNPEEYWTVEAEFSKPKDKIVFPGKLSKIDNKSLEKFDLKKTDTETIEKDLINAQYKVADVVQKKTSRAPGAPFTTSTLQQEAHRRIGFSAKQTMMVAQQLYEGLELGSLGHTGLITYMRTDSVNLSTAFLAEAVDYIKTNLGKEFTTGARIYKTKSKLAQEAHEAIRPASVSIEPGSIKQYLTTEQFKLYNLVWSRAVASQMVDAEFANTSLDIVAKKYTFRATGQTISFPGFLKIYETETKDSPLPPLALGDVLDAEKLESIQHFTEPPARFNDASLVKVLEENGIGRPSTYSPTISTIIARRYVERNNERRFVPTEVGMMVNDLLVENFPQIVDYAFTAKMEDELDLVAEEGKDWVPAIREFYTPFKALLDKSEKELEKQSLTEEVTDEICDKDGAPMKVKFGRFGKFLACSKFPECKNTKSMDKAVDRPVGVKCPTDGGEILERRSRRGKTFFSCGNWPACKFALWQKPMEQKCPKCGSLLTELKKSIKCTNKECDYVITKEE